MNPDPKIPEQIRVVVTGAAGRMGARIAALVPTVEPLVLAAAVERGGHPAVGLDLEGATGTGGGHAAARITDDLKAALAVGDVVIDFTTPQASLEILRGCVETGRPVVIGTTGFTASEKDEIARAARHIGCVLSPNMSVAMNVMYQVVRRLARWLGETHDMEIVEVHHRMKADAPSGTALRLAELMAGELGWPLEEVLTTRREGRIGERKSREIGVQAIRAGDIIGEHTVIFAGVGERLEVTHRAQSRDNFARGALLAARWIVGRPPGLYDMAHVLGISD